jgi:transposase
MGLAQGKKYRLSDAYRFEGFRPQAGKVRGIFGKPQAQILPLDRRSTKTCCGECGTVQRGWCDSEIKQIRDLPCGGSDDMHMYLEIEFRRVLCRNCGKVQSERLEWLGDNPLYTKRFSMYVGKRCRDASIEIVAKDFDLDLDTVEEMIESYRR